MIGAIRLEPVDERVGVAEGEQVPAGRLVRHDTEPLLRYSAGEVEREEPVVATDQHAGADVRPRLERPRLGEDVLRLTGYAVLQRRRDYVLRHVVQEGDHHVEVGIRVAALALVELTLCLRLTGVVPPLSRSLARRRDHRGDQDEQLDGQPAADHGRGERPHGLADDDQVRPLPHGVHDRVRVVGEAGVLITDRQVGRDDLVAAVDQQRHDPVPVEGIRSTVDQDVRGHALTLPHEPGKANEPRENRGARDK